MGAAVKRKEVRTAAVKLTSCGRMLLEGGGVLLSCFPTASCSACQSVGDNSRRLSLEKSRERKAGKSREEKPGHSGNWTARFPERTAFDFRCQAQQSLAWQSRPSARKRSSNSTWCFSSRQVIST